MPEKLIGEVTHFFAKPMVMIIKLTSSLKKGDRLHIKGHSTDMTFVVDSMQIDFKPFESVEAGAEVGIKVPQKARTGDLAFLVTEA